MRNEKEYVSPDLTVYRFAVNTEVLGWPDGSGLDPWPINWADNGKKTSVQPFTK